MSPEEALERSAGAMRLVKKQIVAEPQWFGDELMVFIEVYRGELWLCTLTVAPIRERVMQALRQAIVVLSSDLIVLSWEGVDRATDESSLVSTVYTRSGDTSSIRQPYVVSGGTVEWMEPVRVPPLNHPRITTLDTLIEAYFAEPTLFDLVWAVNEETGAKHGEAALLAQGRVHAIVEAAAYVRLFQLGWVSIAVYPQSGDYGKELVKQLRENKLERLIENKGVE